MPFLSTDKVSSNNIADLNFLVQLYDTAIGKQQTLLDRARDGRFKSAQISDEVLLALIRSDLNLLKEDKSNVMKLLNSPTCPTSDTNQLIESDDIEQ